MGLGDYQLILYPAGNMPELTDMGMDFVGPFNFNFNEAVQILKSVDCLRNYSPQTKWPSFDDACYYLYDLPPNTKCERTSDFQGGSKENAYYVTILQSHHVDVYIKLDKSNFFNNEYTLLKLEVSEELQTK